MHPQEAAFEETRAHAHPRDHAKDQPARGLAGGVHRGRGAPQAHRHRAVLAPLLERQEAGGDRVHQPPPTDDDEPNDQALQAGQQTGDAGNKADDGRGRAGGGRAAEQIPQEVRRRAGVRRGGG